MAVKKEVVVCDTIDCRMLADRTCCICKYDGCTNHLSGNLGLGLLYRTASGSSGATLAGDAPICHACGDFLRDIVNSESKTEGVGYSIFKPVRDALLERFRPIFAAAVVELQAARSAVTLAKTR